MKQWIWILFLMVSVGSAQVLPSFTNPCDKGNVAYTNQEYQQALRDYDACLQQGVRSADLFYNRGNAHFRLDHLGPAIRDYKIALKLNPTHEDARANLAFAELKTQDRNPNDLQGEENPVLKGLWSLHHLFTLDHQLMILLVISWLCVVLLAVSWLVSKKVTQTVLHVGLFVLVLISLPVALSAGLKAWQRGHQIEAVVLERAVDVMSGPGDQYQVLHEIHEGTVVEVQKLREDWMNVHLGDQISGFVKSEKMGVVQ